MEGGRGPVWPSCGKQEKAAIDPPPAPLQHILQMGNVMTWF